MITTKVGVPFTLRGIQYILPEAGEFWQSCTNCIFYRKKGDQDFDPYEFCHCLLKSVYRKSVVAACNGHASVYQKFKESKNE